MARLRRGVEIASPAGICLAPGIRAFRLIFPPSSDRICYGCRLAITLAGAWPARQPGRYYTLQQLEQAGLKAGQPDAQFHPGS
jgi:hypothetical protein